MGGFELLVARILVGAVSGGIASFCSCPIEVCLVRMQVRFQDTVKVTAAVAAAVKTTLIALDMVIFPVTVTFPVTCTGYRYNRFYGDNGFTAVSFPAALRVLLLLR